MDPTAEILLVDDDANDVELILRALPGGGASVAVAHDGAEALHYLRLGEASGPMPHFVLLDLKLPKVSGLDVLRRIRSDSRIRSLPVIVLTSSRELGDVRAAYEHGANSYICKPVDFDEFATRIRALGQYWSKMNEPPR